MQLTPGTSPADSLMRIANTVGKVDLLIVPAELDVPSQSRAWFFVPRMLHEQSVVFVRKNLENGRSVLRLKPRDEIHEQSAAVIRRPRHDGSRDFDNRPASPTDFLAPIIEKPLDRQSPRLEKQRKATNWGLGGN